MSILNIYMKTVSIRSGIAELYSAGRFKSC